VFSFYRNTQNKVKLITLDLLKPLMQENLKRTINELVSENHIRASILYYFGVKFYDYETNTLEEVCSRHGLNAQSVISALELVDDGSAQTLNQLQKTSH
jgi:regulator of cell morphogenesis and NO signaling